MIDFKNVSKVYADTVALKNATLHIYQGDFVFVVGPTGSGKSTFIKLIIKEIEPDEGEIIVDGKNLSKMSNRDVAMLRRDIGMVFQDFTLLENKTVFTVPIDESVKAGVVTSLKGVRAFIPASQLSTSYVEDVNEWIGKEIDVVIITADREKQRLVLSGREAAKIKRDQARKEKIESLKVGTVLEGKVETIKPYGAFVDLGDGISGLVHISQMSTKRVATPEEVCKEGDVVKVKITRVKDGKVSLSMKALEEAPAPAQDDIPDISKFVSREKATTSLGDLLKNIKLD